MREHPFRVVGWDRDLPDHRDYTPRHLAVLRMLDAPGFALPSAPERPTKVDRREYFGPAQDQGTARTSAALSCVALVQYFERFSSGRLVQPSSMFVHKAAARMLDQQVDLATSLRATLKAMVRFGLPPEHLCPYAIEQMAVLPDVYCFNFCSEWNNLRYARLDPRGATGGQVLETVQAFLAAGFPSAFGFLVTTALSRDAEIPFPTLYDLPCGSQAVVAVGYDDRRRIRSERGALLIRNSWGTGWGQEGYGWLPYAYVRQQLAGDFWTLLRPEWLASGEFSRPVELGI